MTQPEDVIQQQTSQVRDYINNPRKHYELRQDKPLFSQLCSSLDVIGDTQEAIIAFKTTEFGDNRSALYLGVYGLLQAIYVQQDAVNNLCESLGIPERIGKYSRLRGIREIRNAIIGHPTKRDTRRKGQFTSYHHISRMSLSQTGFDVLSFFSDGTSKFGHIDIPELITEQRTYISEILCTLIANLEAEEKAHKENFRMEKLADIFPDTLGYNFEKVFEGIVREDYAEFAALNLDQISRVVQNFRQAIGRRNMDFYESLEDEYNQIEHATTHLGKYFRSKTTSEKSEIEKPTARIFATFLRDQVEGLKQNAREIDEEYTK